MKRFVLFLMVGILLFSFSLTAYASAMEAKSRYEDFETFEELVKSYYEAVDNEDIAEQKRLEEIAERTLKEDLKKVEEIRRSGKRFGLFSYDRYIKWSEWIERGQVISLSIQPNRGPFEYWSEIEKAEAWDALVTTHSEDLEWKNEDSLGYQFMCHARYLWNALKQPWNIEPHKSISDINPITCN